MEIIADMHRKYTVHTYDKYVIDLIHKDNHEWLCKTRENKAMNTTSELIYLHKEMERLCDLYLAIGSKPEAKDIIQELKTKINSIYSEIMSKKGR